jgi:hypothetical protein
MASADNDHDWLLKLEFVYPAFFGSVPAIHILEREHTIAVFPMQLDCRTINMPRILKKIVDKYVVFEIIHTSPIF